MHVSQRPRHPQITYIRIITLTYIIAALAHHRKTKFANSNRLVPHFTIFDLTLAHCMAEQDAPLLPPRPDSTGNQVAPYWPLPVPVLNVPLPTPDSEASGEIVKRHSIRTPRRQRFGNNVYGSAGMLKCAPCRHAKAKVTSQRWPS